MKNFFKKSFIVFILFISFLLVTITSYANNVFSNLSENIFRLHIIANSDSKEDQDLKLKIRDGIINYLENINKNSSSKSEVINFCKNNTNTLKEIAKKIINDSGYNYEVKIEIGTFYFPTKNYANISLPAGYYDALRIKIGDANGKNWWCSLFPPLCFVDISSGVLEEDDSNMLEENLTEEEFSLISENSTEMNFKFKIIELVNEKLNKINTSLASKN